MNPQRGAFYIAVWVVMRLARYHYETRRDAERKYPHRVDVLVPPTGLGNQWPKLLVLQFLKLNDMIEW